MPYFQKPALRPLGLLLSEQQQDVQNNLVLYMQACVLYFNEVKRGINFPYLCQMNSHTPTPTIPSTTKIGTTTAATFVSLTYSSTTSNRLVHLSLPVMNPMPKMAL